MTMRRNLARLAPAVGALLLWTRSAAGAEEVAAGQATCPSGAAVGACGAAADAVAAADGPGLSMLQRSAAGRDGDRPAATPLTAGPSAASTQGTRDAEDLALQKSAGGPIPAQQIFKGCTMLHMKLPMSPVLLKTAEDGWLLGRSTETADGFTIDNKSDAVMTVAYFPDAPMGWKGVAGQSEVHNLPHHLLYVQVPIKQGNRSLYQTIFALADDDAAVMLYRMGSGVPAKLANFSLASAPSPDDKISVSRRGKKVIDVAVSLAESADVAEVDKLFDRIDLSYGTDLSNTLPKSMANYSTTYKKRVTQAKVHEAKKVDVSLSMGASPYEPLYKFFAVTTPTEAWWITADLAITTTIVEAPRPAMPVTFGANVTAWRVQGDVLTEKRADPNSTIKLAYRDGDVVWTKMKLNRDKVKPYLPPSMTLAGDIGTIWHVRWQPANIMNAWGMMGPVLGQFDEPLEYNELWVVVPVEIRGRQFMFPIVMLLDDDVAEMLGHDVVGCPKKLGNLTYVFNPKPENGASVALHASRRGRKTFSLTGTIGERTRDPVLGINDNKNTTAQVVWLISQQFARDPTIDRPKYFFCMPFEKTYDQRELKNIQVELGSSAQEPLGEWFTGKPLEGGYIKMDQDWLPANTPLSWQFDRIPAEGYQEWWARSFQVLYM